MSREVQKLPSAQNQPNDGPNEHPTYTGTGVPRRVHVKGTKGVEVTVVVTVVQGKVWMSISPPFTWEAIMEPGKVGEVMHVLELAQEEAKKTAANEGKAVVRGDHEEYY